MPRQTSSGSVYTISESESDDFAPASSSSPQKPASKRATTSKPGPALKGKAKAKPAGIKRKAADTDIEDVPIGLSVERAHDSDYHAVENVAELQEELLSWFEGVRDKRGMPWRKRYDPSMTIEEKGQRAYEIWVSEVMLQQTQVATVIAFWQRWIEKWPTIADLAKADVEEVNAMWRGLGYYRRARSLLSGAKTVMGDKKYKGRLPDDPAKMEKEIDGVGRYTAGAICSMAYGVRTPIIDGNIHRLFTRLLAIHASQVSPQTIKALWAAATDLIGRLPVDEARQGIAGDWNQALMELGSQVCKPVGPDCAVCPLRSGCKAYAELNSPPPPPTSKPGTCKLCEPIPTSRVDSRIPSVTIFPMRKEKKASREEDEVVCVTELRIGAERHWLLAKRPEKGLLAGLFEPPTTPIPSETASADQKTLALSTLSDILGTLTSSLLDSGYDITHSTTSSISHIFSHINMTYHIQHLILTAPESVLAPPPISAESTAVWLDAAGVENANVGTGVKKVWAEIYGSWGSFEVGGSKGKAKAKGSKGKAGGGGGGGGVKRKSQVGDGPPGKIVKKIMMPSMPC